MAEDDRGFAVQRYGSRAPDQASRLWPLYAEVFGDFSDFETWRADMFDRHAARDGYRLIVATDGPDVAGFSWGYTGQRGQYWPDLVCAVLPAAAEHRRRSGRPRRPAVPEPRLAQARRPAPGHPGHGPGARLVLTARRPGPRAPRPPPRPSRPAPAGQALAPRARPPGRAHFPSILTIPATSHLSLPIQRPVWGVLSDKIDGKLAAGAPERPRSGTEIDILADPARCDLADALR